MTAVLQSVVRNYDTDLFTPLIKRAAELTGVIDSPESKKEYPNIPRSAEIEDD